MVLWAYKHGWRVVNPFGRVDVTWEHPQSSCDCWIADCTLSFRLSLAWVHEANSSSNKGSFFHYLLFLYRRELKTTLRRQPLVSGCRIKGCSTWFWTIRNLLSLMEICSSWQYIFQQRLFRKSKSNLRNTD